jgi:chromosome segregation ATPase
MHLLREAEAHLGRAVWEKVGDIERLSIEYWNLRKLLKEREELGRKIDNCIERLDAAHAVRADLLTNSPKLDPELAERRNALLADLEDKARARDEVVAKAREIRRIYEGIKMKLDVITKEADSGDDGRRQEIAKVKQRLAELKDEFSSLKQERLRIGEEIEKGDAELDEIDSHLDSRRRERRDLASQAFQVIGEINKELSELRAEDGLLDTRIRQLHGDIGRFVSRNAHTDPMCAAAIRSHRALAEVMRAMRRSVSLNHKLAGPM